MDTSFLDEDLDMIEVLDHPALFTDSRIPRAAVPKGLYAYDLYESCDTGKFYYISKSRSRTRSMRSWMSWKSCRR